MTLPELNELPSLQRKEALATCCGASAWVAEMDKLFPVESKDTLFDQADVIWFSCTESDWKEAFAHHPKIGDIDSLRAKFASTSHWTSSEQAGTASASQEILEQLAEGNRKYEEKFGYIFIVCAIGKSAEEMLNLLRSRLPNRPEDEILIAAQEQNKITLLRLKKLLTT
ncbi:2-oxo-4-hydroxy-4-carboxy-5-ureidoimidazoline decarboxylase [Spirosoma daeguense]